VRDDGEGAAAADFFGHRGRIPVDCAAFYRLAARHAIDLDPARVKAWSMIQPDRLPQSAADAAPALLVLRLPHGDGLELPAYETAGSAGMDLRAAVDEDKPVELAPGDRFAVPTGLVMEIPQGFEGQVRPRSGLALKSGITCLNTPGTIDSDYRGEVKVILANLGTDVFTVTRGMRIAQLVIAPVVQARIVVHDSLSETVRGSGGFGSTGTA
jgi:dUTP pyrophosphatase